MTLATMSNNLLRYVPGLTTPVIESVIQDSYRQLCAMEWERLNLSTTIYTVAPYGTGTVTVASDGTVTGDGTTFSTAMEGRWMRVYYEDAFFQVETVNSGTELVVVGWPGEVVSTATKFSIFQHQYQLPSTVGQVYSVVYQTKLLKKSVNFIDRLDPSRSTTSDSPIWWAFDSVSAVGVITIQVYPVPSSVVPVQIHGKYLTPTLASATVGMLPEPLIEAHALMGCYRVFQAMNRHIKLGPEIESALFQYQSMLETFKEEDRLLDAHAEKVKDTMGEVDWPTDANFSLSHDVG